MHIVQKTISVNGARCNAFIVGNWHHNQKEQDFITRLVKKSSRRELVIGLEGLMRDPVRERASIPEMFGFESPMAFGIEDEFVHLFTATVIRFNDLTHALMRASITGDLTQNSRDCAVTSIMDLPYLVRSSPLMKGYWTRIATTLPKTERHAYDFIDAFVSENFELPLKDFVGRFMPAIGTESIVTWASLFKSLSHEMLKKAETLPETERPDCETIGRYLANPLDNSTWEYIQNGFNGEWRDNFMFKHMMAIVEIAMKNRVDAYFAIGRLHVENISAKFDSVSSAEK